MNPDLVWTTAMFYPVFTPARRSRSRVHPALGETSAATAVLAVLWWQGGRLDQFWATGFAEDLVVLLTVAAACVATAAAILARMQAGPARRLAGPLTFYGIVLIPLGIFHLPGGLTPAIAVSGFAAGGLFLALLAWALHPFCGPRWPTAVALAVALTFAAGVTGEFLALPSDLSELTLATALVAVGWLVVAGCFVVRGARRDEPVTWRIGFGLAVVALAHLDALVLRPDPARPAVDFAALRLLGLLILLLLLAGPAVRALREAQLRERERDEQLAAAERDARELAGDIAERNHEIRNLVSGLAGISHVLGERTPLGSAVEAELERLRHFVDPASAQDGTVQLDTLLTRHAELRRMRGTDIDLLVDPDLRTPMPAAELAQVVTNLLVNCERHASGSRVWIRAGRRGPRLWILVSDEGPGYSPKGGLGTGLRVSARLLAEHGGTLSIGPNLNGRRGCTALVRLPAADAA